MVFLPLQRRDSRVAGMFCLLQVSASGLDTGLEAASEAKEGLREPAESSAAAARSSSRSVSRSVPRTASKEVLSRRGVLRRSRDRRGHRQGGARLVRR